MGDVREQNQGWIGDTYSFALLAFHDDTLLSKTGTLAGVGYKVFIAANVPPTVLDWWVRTRTMVNFPLFLV